MARIIRMIAAYTANPIITGSIMLIFILINIYRLKNNKTVSANEAIKTFSSELKSLILHNEIWTCTAPQIKNSDSEITIDIDAPR